LAALSCALACDPCRDESGVDIVEVDGFELSDVFYPNTGGSIRIVHDGNGAIQFVNVDGGQLVQEGQVRAKFTPEALAVLNGTVALQCPPPLLAALDEMCRDMVVALPTCSASPWFQDCELVE
jgi:hypothetical protein